ncbi:MAG: AMP-binding protein, partial [Acidobacteriota bacterium]|nr:AMP-binding protein [Acidobacteriota bacterium]
ALSPAGSRETIGGLLSRNLSRFESRAAIREKRSGRFVATTWGQLACEVSSLATFLRSRGIGAGDRVALASRNRREMLASEFAVMGLGAIYTPIFHAYAAEQLVELLRHSGAVAVIGGGGQLASLRPPESVRVVVVLDPPSGTETGTPRGRRPGQREVERVCYQEAINKHPVSGVHDPVVAEFLAAAAAVDPERPCLMMYTSGTSGRQKGVLLSHDNILSQQRALASLWRITADDRFLTYLPWHHSFGGIFEKYTALYNGAALALDDSYGKDFELLLANFKTIKPTAYFSVPKIHQDLVNHVRLNPEDEGQVFHDGLRFIFTAAAPLPSNISDFFAVKGIPVVEGWGLTETSPCCTLTDLNEPRSVPGMVGYPIPGVMLKLAPDGEILVRGANVMRGYHDDSEATKRALPGDGWFRTGDLGEFVGKGLKLVTRKDRVFKLLNAEKIVPTVLEVRLAGMNKYIEHVIVVGDGESFLAALVFPDFFLIKKEFGGDEKKADEVIKSSLKETVERFNAENPVKYERLQAFAVVDKALTIEDDELTPSMKVRVRNVLEHSEGFIEAIYEPTRDCDCRFLRKVMRLTPDDRPCFRGKDVTLDRCHECGPLLRSADLSSRREENSR